MKVDVVFETTASAVPEIAPVDAFKDNPVGKEPAVSVYVIVFQSASVAVAGESEYEERPASPIVPNVPAAVAKTGTESKFIQLSN